MQAAMSGNMQPATWSSSYTQSPHGTGTLALHGLSRATRHPRRAEKRNRASVPNQVPRVGRGWWAGFSEKPLSPGTRAEQLAEAPLGEAPPPPPRSTGPGPWALGKGAVLGEGTEGPGRGWAPWDRVHQNGPCQQGEAGAVSTPSKEKPTPARLSKVSLALGAHEAQARPGGP